MSGLAPFAHLYSMKLRICESLSSSSSEEEIKRPEEFDEQQAKYKKNTKADLRSSIEVGNCSVHLISALHILEYLNLINSLLWCSSQKKCTLNEGMKSQEARGSKQVN